MPIEDFKNLTIGGRDAQSLLHDHMLGDLDEGVHRLKAFHGQGGVDKVVVQVHCSELLGPAEMVFKAQDVCGELHPRTS